MTADKHSHYRENISREEAIRRINARPIAPDIKRFLIERLPDNTPHYILFKNGLFLEFATLEPGANESFLMLEMPYTTPPGTTNIFEVKMPLTACSDKSTFSIGPNKDLLENGAVRPSFRFSTARVRLRVNINVIDWTGNNNRFPCLNAPDPVLCFCKLACEYVHSQLDIHWADPICCFYL